MPDIVLKKNIKFNKKNILYVAMNLYRGNCNLLTGNLSDFERYEFEKKIIEKILKFSNKPIDYKPYPMVNLRYTDKDPIFDTLKKIDIHKCY